MCVCVCEYIQPGFETLETRDYDFFFVVIDNLSYRKSIH